MPMLIMDRALFSVAGPIYGDLTDSDNWGEGGRSKQMKDALSNCNHFVLCKPRPGLESWELTHTTTLSAIDSCDVKTRTVHPGGPGIRKMVLERLLSPWKDRSSSFLVTRKKDV